MRIDKIGMYKTDEILEFMTEGEGRNFLGRSMFDAMYFEIERLNNIINRTTKYVESLSSKGRGCDIYEDIKQEILQELKGSNNGVWVNNLLEVIKENNIEFGSDKE